MQPEVNIRKTDRLMKITEITARVLESFTGIPIEELGMEGMIKQADQDLPHEASRAIDNFVGVPHDARQKGYTFGIMQSERLEDAYSPSPSPRGRIIRQQIDSAFAPIKAALRSKFGEVITLYRHQEDLSSGSKERHTLSWTSDPRIAIQFAGVNGYLMRLKPITNADIEKALRTYAETGKLNFKGKTYVRTDQPTDDPNVDEFYYDIIKDGEVLTDGDDIAGELKSVQAYYQDLIDKRESRLRRIMSAKIPINDIIWITDRAGQSEFILHNQPGKAGYVDATGRLIK